VSAISSLRNKLIAAAGGGAMLIASLFLGGQDGVEGRKYEVYKVVAGVWTVCDGRPLQLCLTLK